MRSTLPGAKGLSLSRLVLMGMLGVTAALLAPSACSLNTEGAMYDENASSAVGSGASGGGGVGGDVASPEDCLDGIDNDLNGRVDCDDPDSCAELVECVDAAPDGWGDYARLYVEAFPSSKPQAPCPPGFTAEAHYVGPAKPEEQCTPCSCQIEGGACSAPEISCFKKSGNCAGNAEKVVVTAMNAGCVSMTNFEAAQDPSSCKLTGPAIPLDKGTCTATGGALAPAWKEVVFACIGKASPVNDGCGAGKACVAKGGGVYNASECVSKGAHEECPDGWLTTRIDAYAEGSDTRTCPQCDCEPLTCMGGGYTVYSSNRCTPSSADVESDMCKDVTGQLDDTTGSLGPKLAAIVKGGCKAGAPSGALTPGPPRTFCCR